MNDHEKDFFLQSLRGRSKNLGDSESQNLIDMGIFSAIVKAPNQPGVSGIHFAIWALEQKFPLTYLLGVRSATAQQLQSVRNMHTTHNVDIKVNKRKVTKSKRMVAAISAREIAYETKKKSPSLLPNWDLNKVLPSPISSTMTLRGPMPESNLIRSLFFWEKYYLLLLIDRELSLGDLRKTLLHSLNERVIDN